MQLIQMDKNRMQFFVLIFVSEIVLDRKTSGFCSEFRYESNGILVLGVEVFFLQTNFDFLSSQFGQNFVKIFTSFERYCCPELKSEKIFHLFTIPFTTPRFAENLTKTELNFKITPLSVESIFFLHRFPFWPAVLVKFRIKNKSPIGVNFNKHFAFPI